jgi:hypothetical protein
MTVTVATSDVSTAKDTAIHTQSAAEQSQPEATDASANLPAEQTESEQLKQTDIPTNTSMDNIMKKQNVVSPDDDVDADSTDLPIYSSDTPTNSHSFGYQSLSATMSRTQQKLMLMRQHFLADDENYLNHPRNQVKLTKVMERINREYDSITMFRDPVIESMQRVFTKYAHDHPEVLDDDYGAGYSEKDWLGGEKDKENESIVADGSGYGSIR